MKKKQETISFTARLPKVYVNRIKAAAGVHSVSEAYVVTRLLEAGFQTLDQATAQLPQIQTFGSLSPLLLSVPANFEAVEQ